jgi:hypothetical protein
MSIFDMICVGVLAADIGGYIWIKASRKFAPPQD